MSRMLLTLSQPVPAWPFFGMNEALCAVPFGELTARYGYFSQFWLSSQNTRKEMARLSSSSCWLWGWCGIGCICRFWSSCCRIPWDSFRFKIGRYLFAFVQTPLHLTFGGRNNLRLWKVTAFCTFEKYFRRVFSIVESRSNCFYIMKFFGVNSVNFENFSSYFPQ